MKCEFCGKDLNFDWCTNISCVAFLTVPGTKLYNALIDGKKAQEALKAISGILLLDEPKPSVLMPAGKKEIKRRIAEITEPKEE